MSRSSNGTRYAVKLFFGNGWTAPRRLRSQDNAPSVIPAWLEPALLAWQSELRSRPIEIRVL